MVEQSDPRPHLIATIDGGSAQFALASPGSPVPTRIWTAKTDQYPTFIDALQHYLKAHDLQPRDYRAAIAVAGVRRGDVVSVAHCRWYITVSGLRSFLRSEPLVINELAATAWSLTVADVSRLQPVGGPPPGPIAAGGTYAVIGASVGLGVAVLHVTERGETVILQSEGGHASFAPQDPIEDAVLAQLRAQFGHVSYERLLSGPGFENVYGALAVRQGRTGTTSPPSIRAAVAGNADPLATQALALFSACLGSFIGSTALTVGAWSGVFLTGELLHGLLPLLRRTDIRASVTAKGRLGKLLAQVPIAFLDHPHSSLAGAAAALNACHDRV